MALRGERNKAKKSGRRYASLWRPLEAPKSPRRWLPDPDFSLLGRTPPLPPAPLPPAPLPLPLPAQSLHLLLLPSPPVEFACAGSALLFAFLLHSLELHHVVGDGCIREEAFLGHTQYRREKHVEQHWREHASLPETLDIHGYYVLSGFVVCQVSMQWTSAAQLRSTVTYTQRMSYLVCYMWFRVNSESMLFSFARAHKEHACVYLLFYMCIYVYQGGSAATGCRPPWLRAWP